MQPLESAINRYSARMEAKPEIEMLVISHFHRDHVSGLPKLLNRIRVKRILLPYVPLWERLVIGFEQNIDPGDPLMLFYLNPVAYLVQISIDGGIQEVVFVPPGGAEGPPADESSLPNFSDAETQVVFPTMAADWVDDVLVSSDSRTVVAKFDVTRSVAVGRGWEFVPYNDAVSRSPPADFRKSVEAARDQLDSAGTREDALQKLKEIYNFVFPGRAQNRASLLLYGGPLAKTTYPAGMVAQLGLGVFEDYMAFSHRGGVLYTGDADLSKSSELQRLYSYLGTARINKVGVLQVMHHGSRYNSHPGVAESIRPTFSVFCSDPEGMYGHPDAEVLKQFAECRPTLVNRRRGACFRSRALFP